MTTSLVRLTVLGSILPLLAACVTVGPDYQKPNVVTPAGWNSRADSRTPQLGDWWKNLKDPVLDQLIADGIAGSPDVATAKAKVRQARANYTSAGGALYPKIDGDGSYKRSDTPATFATNQSSTGFNTTWELDLFGGNKRGVEAAYYNVESANEQLRAALVTLIGDIATNYARLRGAQADIAIAQRNAASQRQTVALTRSQLEAGNISQVDLLSAETQAVSTEAQIPALRISYAQYLNQLSVLTGRSSSALASVLDRPRSIPTIPRKVTAGLPADLLLSRPDVRAAERDYASSTASVGQKQALLYPGVSLAGNINMGGSNFGDLGKLSTISWSFGPSLSVPIFHGGQLNADVEAARAARDQSFVAYRKSILTALSEVENASVSLNQNRLRAAQLQKIVSNSRKINELTLEQYRAGTKSFVDVLTAQRDLLSAETNLSQARTDLVLNYVALQKALGGGWNGMIDVAKPEVVDGYTGPRIAKTAPLPPLATDKRPL
ncbi:MULTISPECIES: efflux transporter outer membrane subunit [unclassified Ochrobactrum]|uniref:efflux transporter outer membrane subunit n=1 Tax=unclassified Ochrobactrum TaxID=239106 RepID=UPI000DEF3A3E|nr:MULTISPECIES: efflux transporter outer membrane subunit [unclassified Ochrobactrum]MBQ0707350.1 efflux transporter outer membrane subunit [Ochrobactrum sp. AP1BH01-1]